MRNLLTFFLLVSSGFLYSQCMLVEVPLENRISGAPIILEGEVISSGEIYRDEHNIMHTVHRVAVLQLFKGSYPESEILVETPGGVTATEIHRITPSLQLKAGETGIFFLEAPGERQLHEAYGGPQGFIAYDPHEDKAYDAFHTYEGISGSLYETIINQVGQAPRVIKKYKLPTASTHEKGADAITSISPLLITAGTNSVLTIKGNNFGATRGAGFVSFPNASSGPPSVTPENAQYLLWSNEEIRVEVPSGAGTGKVTVKKTSTFESAETLTIQFAQLNVTTFTGDAFQADHINQNSQGGYSFRMSNAFDANTNAKSSFIRAMESWRDVTCVNWEVIEPTPINNTAQDGTNIVRFGNSGELSAGVLATTFSRYQACNSSKIWYVSEIDLTYDPDVTWNFDASSPKFSEFDIESVTLHELGHAHQLGHVIDASDVMHRSIGPGENKRTLPFNSRVAGKFVQAQSVQANVCGPGPMLNYPGCLGVGIDEEKEENAFAVYPNPASDHVDLSWNRNIEGPVNITLIDYAGKQVLTMTTDGNNIRLSTAELNAGLYLVQLNENGNTLHTERLIIE